MILERSLRPQFLTNTFLVAAEAGGEAFFVDAGGPMEPLFEKVAEHDLTPTHVLLTHHHYDHVSEIGAIVERYPGVQVLIHPLERDLVDDATGTLDAGTTIHAGGLDVQTIHIPGHTAGMLGFLVEGHVFTGDTLFKSSVGGVRAPGSTSYADLKASVMDTLMALPPETIVLPGHTDYSTIADEYDNNAFVRVWRGLDPEGAEPVKALGEDATLVLLGDDYDGGHKAWVRWPDGRDDIVPGSKVERAA
jgi:glyoxylase-like metal-dependent hydrolase (beta-lactamase superfamily II)